MVGPPGDAATAVETPVAEPVGAPETLGGPEPALTVAAVARRIGVAPATLRTWDRRYGLGPSGHTAGAHRRYSSGDLARLEHMRRLVHDGVAPADAARIATAGPRDGATGGEGGAEAGREVDREGTAGGRWGGGPVVAVPGGSPAARGLARAAMSLDGQAVTRLVAESVERCGVVWTWDHLLVPVLVGVGHRWETTGEGIEVEHLLSESITGVLRSVAARLDDPINVRPVLLACADEDLHSLPLFVLAAALSERRIEAVVLGARVPNEALRSAVRRIGPGVVVIWSQLPGPAGVPELPELPEMRPAPTVMSAGPGWSPHECASPRHLDDLSSGVTAVAAAMGF